MNMVRAGVVDHPDAWAWCGYNEIQNPRPSKGIIDVARLRALLGFDTYEQLKNAHCKWIDPNDAKAGALQKSIAVGSENCIKKIKKALGFSARGRKIRQAGDSFELREMMVLYGPADSFEPDNTHFWDQER